MEEVGLFNLHLCGSEDLSLVVVGHVLPGLLEAASDTALTFVRPTSIQSSRHGDTT